MKKIFGSKRLLSSIAAFALIGASLSGCASKPAETPAEAKPAQESQANADAPAANAAPAPAPATEPAADGAKKSIGILQIVEHPALDATREGFIKALADAGYVDGENIVIDYQNAQGDQSNLKTMTQSLVGNKSDLIFAIATPAAQSVVAETTTIPVVISAVTDPAESGIVDSNTEPNSNVTGTSDMTPVAKQFDLLHKVFPEAKTVGIMYNSSETNSEIQARIAIESAEKLGLTPITSTVTSANDVAQATEALFEKVDIIYVPTDNVLANAMPLMAQISLEKNKPIFGSEEGEVEGGAVMTDGIRYYDLGVLSGEMAVKILKGESTPQEMPIQYLEDTSIIINKGSADKLGIVIPEDILKSAARIIE